MATRTGNLKGFTNSAIAELLALESEKVGTPLRVKALRRASRASLLWPEEAIDLITQGSPLTELNGVGPYISGVIQGWLDNPPRIEEKSELRRGFLTLTEARFILAKNPNWKVS